MSEYTPAPGDDASRVEYLGDAPGPRESRDPGEPRPRRRRRALVGLTVGALVVAAGAGAFAAAQFLGGGPQAASAAPADTMAWLQVDLDPSGGQKLAAYQTLKKFPALDEHLGLTSQDDLRRWVFHGLTSDTDCDKVDFSEVDPWLGSALGVGVRAPQGDADPVPFFALEVTDQDKAAAGARSLADCLGEDHLGTAFRGDFMIVAETSAQAKAIAAAAASSALADDPTYEARTGEAGDDGVVTGYAAPALGDFMADQLKGVGQMFEDSGSSGGSATLAGRAGALSEDTSPQPGEVPSGYPSDFPTDFPTDLPTDLPGDLQRNGPGFGGGLGMDPYLMGFGPGLLFGLGAGGGFDKLAGRLADFEGAGLQVRFADESLELEVASHGLGGDLPESGSVDLGTLPQGTGLAFGTATGQTWARSMLDQLKASDPQGFDRGMKQGSAETGLTLPDDLETLAGDSLTVAVDSTVDLPSVFSSFFLGMGGSDVAPGPGTVPVGVRIAGDPSEIGPVAEKLADYASHSDGPQVFVAEGDDAVAIGLDQDYVDRLVRGGDLGGSKVFKQALPGGGDAVSGAFADFDANGWLDKALQGASKEDRANLEPLSGLGVTSTRDGDVLHATARLTTD